MATVDTRTLSPRDLEELRRKAVSLVLGGMRQAVAARHVGVREATMSDWMRRYRGDGSAGLTDRRRGPARQVLTERQEARIRRLIEGNAPGQLRLEFALWTTMAVIELIRVKVGKVISKTAVHRLLHAWGFTPKKGTRQAWQQDQASVQHWLVTEYPQIALRARREKATIFWCDETGVRSDEGTTVGWSAAGEPAIMTANGHRHACNVISAIDNQGGLAFQVYTGGFRVSTFLGFLRRLIAHGKGRKVFAVLDRHPVHRAKRVHDWVAQHRAQIELFFLPAYSPELNPDEYLNNDLKGQTVRRRPPMNQPHLMSMVRGHLRRRQRQPHIVARFFQAPHVRYAA